MEHVTPKGRSTNFCRSLGLGGALLAALVSMALVISCGDDDSQPEQNGVDAGPTDPNGGPVDSGAMVPSDDGGGQVDSDAMVPSDDGGGQADANGGAAGEDPPVAFDPAGCEAPSLSPGDSPTVDIEHDGTERNYIVYVPDGVDPTTPTPLVVNWHGLTSSAVQQQLLSGTAIAEERGFIVAYPDGLGDPGGQSFNAGACCSSMGSPPHEADDVGFGRAVVEDIASNICIDERRIFSTGMSNGGYMSEHNACHAADLYAAVAPVSAMGRARTDCEPSRPISIISFNGTEDPLVSYDGSQDSVASWVERNGCTGEPERETHGDSYCDVWTDCEQGVRVTSCTITAMEHCWPGNPIVLPGYCATGGLEDIDANELMYDFFEESVMP